MTLSLVQVKRGSIENSFFKGKKFLLKKGGGISSRLIREEATLYKKFSKGATERGASDLGFSKPARPNQSLLEGGLGPPIQYILEGGDGWGLGNFQQPPPLGSAYRKGEWAY